MKHLWARAYKIQLLRLSPRCHVSGLPNKLWILWAVQIKPPFIDCARNQDYPGQRLNFLYIGMKVKKISSTWLDSRAGCDYYTTHCMRARKNQTEKSWNFVFFLTVSVNRKHLMWWFSRTAHQRTTGICIRFTWSHFPHKVLMRNSFRACWQNTKSFAVVCEDNKRPWKHMLKTFVRTCKKPVGILWYFISCDV